MVEFKLPSIKAAAAARSDEALKVLLQELAQNVFQVWTATFRWNETSTSSFSNGSGSDPLSSSSWEQVSGRSSVVTLPLPNVSIPAVFPSLEESNFTNSVPTNPVDIIDSQTDHANTIGAQKSSQGVQNGPYSMNSLYSSHQESNAVSSSAGLADVLFPQNHYRDNLPVDECGIWTDQMQQIQFENTPMNFNDILDREMYPNSFTDEGVPPRTMTGINPGQWGDKYPAPHFGRYGEGP